MPSVSAGIPDDRTRAAILALAERITVEDGAPPLSDDVLTHLTSAEVEHFTVGAVAGYAQRHRESAEVAAEPDAVPALLDALARDGLLVWAHGRRSRLASVLPERGFTPVRELHQLRRPLTDLPADPPLPDGVAVRAFRPGRDEPAWLAVNAAAFASHPEQGRVQLADLQALLAQPWFAAEDFLLAEDRSGALLGYHWTKVHPDGLGEVYVLGIAPAAQGLGLGKALLTRGLAHLAERGCPEVLLYVDGDNASALRLYERAGFTRFELDVQWRLG